MKKANKINKMVANAEFWYDGYLRHKNAADADRFLGNEDGAKEHARVAEQFLDMHFKAVDLAMSKVTFPDLPIPGMIPFSLSGESETEERTD